MTVKAIPEGFHSVTPYLLVRDVRALIEFLKKSFDAKETFLHDLGNGHVHAEVTIGDSVVMIGQSDPMPAQIYLYVNDVDATYKRALQAGATSISEPADQPYGDRNAGLKDPSGNTWYVATHKEDVSPEEIQRRLETAGRS